MIIDTSYFTLPPLFIPNAVVQPLTGNNLPTNKQRLQSVIDGMEYQLLFNALGSEQYNEFIDQFEADGTLKTDALQKWVDLVDGKGEWQGLRIVNGTAKKSLIAHYVYYCFLLEDEYYYTTTGIVKQQSENAVPVKATSKLVKEWNTFVFMYQGYEWDCSCNQNVSAISMYQFMASYPELYNVNFFRFYELQTTWGI